MKNLFYATRLDKNGHKLVTSYPSAVNRDKFGGAGAIKEEILYFADFLASGGAKISNDPSGYIMRSYMVNNGAAADSGQFELWGKTNGEWKKTPFSFATYGNANNAMKAMITMYQALLVVVQGDDAEEAIEKFDNGSVDLGILGDA
ncbi:MAG: hypothetical protein EOO61_03260 [Hymenobacter sp.]|nr:MAG: hypothetical protein EOO61_03260 [Hymenobacter sp.]